jgi:hypothetical protein
MTPSKRVGKPFFLCQAWGALHSGLDGCLGFVCKRCAARDPHAKSFCETCNVCQLAEQNSSSMTKAVTHLAELHPQSIKRGKVGCASTIKDGKPCSRCIRKACRHCEQTFRTHANRSPYCGDLCKHAAQREANRQRQERYRENTLAA